MVKWFPTIILVLTGAVTAASPAVQAFWANHAAWSATVMSVVGVVTHLLPSPVSK